MRNQNEQGQSQSQQGSNTQQNRSQSEITSLLNGVNYTDQSQANGFLKQHGLSVEMQQDGKSGIIYDEQNGRQKLATIQFEGTNQDRKVGNITF